MTVDVYTIDSTGELSATLRGQRMSPRRYGSAKSLSKWCRQEAEIVPDTLVGKIRVLYRRQDGTDVAEIRHKDTLDVLAVVAPR